MSIPQVVPLAQPVCAGENAIPASLKAIPQWIAWKYGRKPNRKGKFPKMPVNPYTGKLASVNAPSTWATYEQAAHYARRHDYGIGLVLTADLGLVVIDLDDVITPAGELREFAQLAVDQIDGWTEISPSGRGLHIFVYGSIPASIRQAEIEIYACDRYITITGDRWPGTPAEIPNRSEQVAALYASFAGSPEPAQPPREPAQSITIDDVQLIARMLASRNGEQLRRLWAGDWSDYPSQSEADQALCNALSFWTGRDPGRIDQLFRQSGLMRDKWEVASYRVATLAGALTVAKVYTLQHSDPLPQFTGEIADILKFARVVVAEHQFTGRHAENQQRVALAVLEILRSQNSLEAPMSTRHLAVLAGVGVTTANRALLGAWAKGKSERLDAGLCEWLVERVEIGDGITANVYRLRGEILEKYRDTAKSGSHSKAHAWTSSMRSTFRGIFTISTNMTDDAYARPSFKKGFRRHTADQKPQGGWNAGDDCRDDLVRLFGQLGGLIIDTLLTRGGATIANVATVTGATITDVERTVISLRKTYADLIQLTPPVTRETVLTLPADIETRLTTTLQKTNRIAGLAQLMSTAAEDDSKLKSFTPIGLAIVAQLDAHGDLCFSELAKRLDRHPATISAAVERMSTMLAQNGLEPIMETCPGETDKRKTIVHLHPDWQARVAMARPHLCTDGLNRARNISYALERLHRLRIIAETARNPATLDMIAKIQAGAHAVIEWSEGRLTQIHQGLDQVESAIFQEEPNSADSISNSPS